MSASAGRILMIPKGEYSSTTTYAMLDMVEYNGSSYIAKRTTIGNAPTDTTYWQPLVSVTGKMDRSVYDSNNNGVVDNAERVNGHSVAKDVPANAVFTDTKTFAAMTDTRINSPADGEVPTYNANTSKWENKTINIPNKLSKLTDVEVGIPTDGAALVWSASEGKWVSENSQSVVTWAGGTDAEVAAMIQAHYAGVIDLHDYWAVGDERVVTLSAMTGVANPGGSSKEIVSQPVTLVLMNEGGKELVTPINGINECAFVVGIKNILDTYLSQSSGYLQYGDVMSYTDTLTWADSGMRTWCNSSFRNAFPSTIKSIFKQHKNTTARGRGDTTSAIVTEDYFALPAFSEVFDYDDYKVGIEEANMVKFEFYETAANRIKSRYYLPDFSASDAGVYWLRSPFIDPYSQFNTIQYMTVSNLGTDAHEARDTYPIGPAPFGVI